MTGDFRFQQVHAIGDFIFLEAGGGGENVQFRGIELGQGKIFWPRERVVQGFERLVRLAGVNINPRQKKPRRQIVRGKLADAVELDGRLAHQPALHESNTVFKAKTGLVKRSVRVQDFIPVVIFSELVGGDPRKIHGGGRTGAQGLVEVQIDFGDDVVGIQLLGFAETGRRLFQFTRALKLNPQKIQAAGIKDASHQGVRIRLPAAHADASETTRRNYLAIGNPEG